MLTHTFVWMPVHISLDRFKRMAMQMSARMSMRILVPVDLAAVVLDFIGLLARVVLVDCIRICVLARAFVCVHGPFVRARARAWRSGPCTEPCTTPSTAPSMRVP